jgi:hypothetical protein
MQDDQLRRASPGLTGAKLYPADSQLFAAKSRRGVATLVNAINLTTGLPDGIFSNQKYKFGRI